MSCFSLSITIFERHLSYDVCSLFSIFFSSKNFSRVKRISSSLSFQKSHFLPPFLLWLQFLQRRIFNAPPDTSNPTYQSTLVLFRTTKERERSSANPFTTILLPNFNARKRGENKTFNLCKISFCKEIRYRKNKFKIFKIENNTRI